MREGENSRFDKIRETRGLKGGRQEISVPVFLALTNGMIERNELNIFVMYCDECDLFEEFDTDGDWNSFIDKAKARGWKIRKDEDLNEWFHTCPECVEGGE